MLTPIDPCFSRYPRERDLLDVREEPSERPYNWCVKETTNNILTRADPRNLKGGRNQALYLGPFHPLSRASARMPIVLNPLDLDGGLGAGLELQIREKKSWRTSLTVDRCAFECS